jgi:diketogulonate reductase-like aldo/keto reductase
MEVYIAGLDDAVDAGLARSIGVSNFGLEDLRRAVSLARHPIVANQLLYNVLQRDRVPPELLRFCREHDITVVAYRPVERRLLADQVENPVVRRIASQRNLPASQIAISWLIRQEGVVTIPKAVSREHIDENLGAVDVELSAEEWAELDAVAS